MGIFPKPAGNSGQALSWLGAFGSSADRIRRVVGDDLLGFGIFALTGTIMAGFGMVRTPIQPARVYPSLTRGPMTAIVPFA